MFDLRLTDAELDFWVDVRVRRVGRSWVAVADLASTPEIVGADRPDLALLLALWPLGPDVARRLAATTVARLPLDGGGTEQSPG